MKRKRKRSPSYRYFLSVVALSSYSTLGANPEGMQVVHGLVSSSSSENLLEIHSGQKAIINWDQFSINAGETAKFIQQDASSAVLNRVIGNNLSEIFGSLESNGKIFLINPSGILVGEGARIEVGSFIASTFDILNEDFLTDKGITFSGDSDHALVNLGTIRAKEGDVLLIAHRVRNDGKIEAPNGEVSLNSCQEFLLQPKNSKILIRLTTLQNKEEVGIENNGSIEALRISLEADGNLYAQAISQNGVIEAKSATAENGKIRLVAENSRVAVTGEMTAKNGEDGGTIHVLGKEVLLLDKARFDVTGARNGGEVLLGGDYQGKNPDIYNADVTYVDKNATVLADSLQSGNGGKVILWGEKYTGYFGSISAKGGPLSGDGGFTEISSPGYLSFESIVDLSAANGKFGTLLLDPININIINQTQTTGVDLTTNPVTLPSSPPGPSTVVINNTMLSGQLNSGNVTINANVATGNTGKIYVASTVTWPNTSTLTLITDGIINIGLATNTVSPLMQINNFGTQHGNSLVIDAKGTVSVNDTIINQSGSGGILITCPNFQVNASYRNTGITMSAFSDLTVNANAISMAGASGLPSTASINVGGNVNFQGMAGASTPVGSIVLNSTYGTASITATQSVNASCSLMSLTIAGSNSATSSINSVNGDVNIVTDSLLLRAGYVNPSTVQIYSTNGNVNITPLTAGMGSVVLTDANATSSSSNNIVSQIYSTNGNVNITAQTLTVKHDNNISTTGTVPLNSQIFTGNGNITLNISDSIDVISGYSVNQQSKIYTTGGSIAVNMPAGTLSLTSDTRRAGAGGTSTSITTTGSGAITLEVNQLNINTTGGTSGLISAPDGIISGTVQNININPLGSQNASISANGTTGTINLVSTANNSEYLLQGNGVSGIAQITTGSGNLTLSMNGTSSLLSLAGNTSTAQITSPGGIITLNLGGNDSTLSMVANANVAQVSSTNGGVNLNITGNSSIVELTAVSNNSLIQTTGSGNINFTLSGTNTNVNLSGGTGTSASALVQATGGGSISWQQNGGTLDLTANSGPTSDASIKTTSGSITMMTTDTAITMQSGSGSTEAEAIIQTLGGGSISMDMTGGSLSLQGGTSAGQSLCGILTLTGGNITMDAPVTNISLTGGNSATNGNAEIISASSSGTGSLSITCENLTLTGATGGTGSGEALISLGPADSTGTLDLTVSSLLKLQGGSAPTDTSSMASISISTTPLNLTSLNISAGNIEVLGGTGANSDAMISTDGPIIVTSSGSILLQGNSGNNSSATIVTTSNPNIIVSATDDITLQAGSSANTAIAAITTFSTVNGKISVTANHLSLFGGDSPNSTPGSGGDALIGPFLNPSSVSSVDIDVTNLVTMIGGSNIGNNRALIQAGPNPAETLTFIAGSLVMEGGTGDISNVLIQSIASDLTIDITGNTLSLSGGSGTNSSAQILTQTSSSISIDAPNANISLMGGSSPSSSLAEITSSNTSGSGNVTVIGNSLTMVGGTGSCDGRALIQTGPSSSSETLTIMVTNLVRMIGGQMAGAIGDNEAIIQAPSSNMLSFSAGQLVMQGGTSMTSNAFIQTSTTPITIDIAGRLMSLSGGGGKNSDAVIRTIDGGDVTVSAPNTFIFLNGGSGSITSRAAIIPGDTTGDGSLMVTGRNISLTGGSGTGNDVAVLGTGPHSSAGSITVTATSVSLTGGTGSNLSSASIANAQTETGGNLTINATNLTLMGGNSVSPGDGRAFIATSPDAPSSTLALNISGNIQMTGGGALDGNNRAIIEALPIATNMITFTPSTPQTLQLLGGTGANSSSILQTRASSLTIPVSSALTLQGGSGVISNALITTRTGGDITISGAGATITLIGGSGSTQAMASILPDSSSGEGSLTITAANVNLTGGSGIGDDNALLSTGPASSTGNVSVSASNAVSLTGGSGSGDNAAMITTGNNSTTGTVTVSTSNLVSLTGGSGPGNDVATITTGDLSTAAITVSGANVSLTGGTGTTSSSASIANNSLATAGDLTINATNLTLQGGNSSPSSADGRSFIATSSMLTLNISGNIQMTGGGPLNGNNEAIIEALATVNNVIAFTPSTPQNLQMKGGSGANSSSILQTGSSSLTIPVTSTLSMQGGSGAVSDALIDTQTGGNITVNATNITMVGGSGSTQARAAILPGELSGMASLTINGATLNMTGGSGSGNDNAILATGSAANSSITLNMSGNVSMLGGTASGANNNAIIQTLSTNPIQITASSLTLDGSITPGATGASSLITSVSGQIQMNLANNLILTGGVANNAIANIYSLANQIFVQNAQNVGVNGGSGSGSYAQIGSPFDPINSNMLFNINQNLSVIGGSGVNSYAIIGLGSPFATGSNTFNGNIQFLHVNDVTVQGGVNIGSFAQIGHVNSTLAASTTLSGNILLPASGNMNLTSTPFSGAYSLIGLGGQNSPVSTEMFNGNINVSAANLLIDRGSLTDTTFTIIGFVSPSTQTHPLQIISSNLSVSTTGNISSGLTGNNAATAGIGALALSADPTTSVQIGTLNITTGGSFTLNNPFALIGTSLDFIGTILNAGTGNAIINMNIGTNFDFGETAILSMDKAYIFNCNPHNITANSPITINVGGDFNLVEFPFFNKVKIQSSGTLDITAGGNVFITGSSKSKTGQTILAGKNFTLGIAGKIQNELSGDILLVADNLNDVRPEIGENIDFTIFPTGKVKNQKNTGPVGLYSTTQQNTSIGRPFITATINGSAFLKGPEFVDTPEEMWNVYYPGGTINPNHPYFTVFYKNNGTPQPFPPPPPPPVINPGAKEATIYHSNELISQLLFVNWPILDDYLFWAERFSIRYNLKANQKLKKKAGFFSSYDLFGREKFTIQRERDAFYNHQYELLLLRDIRK